MELNKSVKSNLNWNLISNFLGAVLSIIFIPFQINLLGIEAWGLVGVYLIIQTFFVAFDNSITSALNREIATNISGHKARNISYFNSLYVYIFFLSLIIFIVGLYSGEFLASTWLSSKNIPPEVIAESIFLLFIIVILRLHEGFIRSALLGLQVHKVTSIIFLFSSFMRGGGVILVLLFISNSIQAYFIWQGLISLICFITMVYIFYRLNNFDFSNFFNINYVIENINFSFWVFLTSITSFFISQFDRVLVSKIFDLEQLGYYTFAAVVAGYIAQIMNPIQMTFYPRFSELVEKKDKLSLIDSFNFSNQIIVVLACLFFTTMFFYSQPILELWTQNTLLASNTHFLVVLLSLSFFIGSPYLIVTSFLFAQNKPHIDALKNIFAVIIYIPLSIYAAINFGIVGLASSLVALNLLIIIGINFAFFRFQFLDIYKIWLPGSLKPVIVIFICFYIVNVLFYRDGWIELMISESVSVILSILVLNKCFDFYRTYKKLDRASR